MKKKIFCIFLFIIVILNLVMFPYFLIKERNIFKETGKNFIRSFEKLGFIVDYSEKEHWVDMAIFLKLKSQNAESQNIIQKFLRDNFEDRSSKNIRFWFIEKGYDINIFVQSTVFKQEYYITDIKLSISGMGGKIFYYNWVVVAFLSFLSGIYVMVKLDTWTKS